MRSTVPSCFRPMMLACFALPTGSTRWKTGALPTPGREGTMWRLLPRLAMRNMLRNRRRTLLTLLAIIAGMASVIVFGGFISFTYWGLREMTIHSQMGHLQVYKAGYSAHAVADPVGYYLADFPRVEAEIRKTP